MADQLENNNPQNYVELNEGQIFEKIKKDLNPIQENLTEKKITVDEAKAELTKINERIQWTQLETKNKKEIWKAFEKIMNLEKNIDENTLKNELKEIVNLLETLTQKDLANLILDINQNKRQRKTERPAEVQQWIEESSNNLASTIHDASHDKNPIARKIWQRMENLMW